jgi:hypothetical protein
MTKTKKTILLAACLAALSLVAGRGYAGYKVNGTVQITSTATVTAATGYLGSVRNSADAKEYIACQVDARPNVALQATCYAASAAGTYAQCFSSDPGIVSAALSIKGDSFINFNADANAKCTYLRVDNASYDAPKVL